MPLSCSQAPWFVSSRWMKYITFLGVLMWMELWSAGHQPAIANQGTFCQRDREPAFSILHRQDLNLCLTPGTSGYSERIEAMSLVALPAQARWVGTYRFLSKLQGAPRTSYSIISILVGSHLVGPISIPRPILILWDQDLLVNSLLPRPSFPMAGTGMLTHVLWIRF